MVLGPNAPTPPEPIGPRVLHGAFGEIRTLLDAMLAQDRLGASLLPSRRGTVLQPPSTSPLVAVVGCPLHAAPSCRRAMGRTPKPPPEEGFGGLVSNSLTPNSGT